MTLMLSVLAILSVGQISPGAIAPSSQVSSSGIEAPPVPQSLVAPSPLPVKADTGEPKVRRQVVRVSREIRPLTGDLDQVAVFNSNSPEVVRTPGILLSTFPPKGLRSPRAHLNYAFQGRFDIFSHHIARAKASEEGRTLFQGIMVYNPGPDEARIRTLAAASYISRFEAPFRQLPSYVEDPLGTIFSGAGSRVAADMLRDRRRGIWDLDIRLKPRQARMIMNAPIPVGKWTPSSNTRSTLIHLHSDRPVHLASLAMFSPKAANGRETIPTLRQWQNLLVNGFLAGPRDIAPSPLNATGSQFFYGRIAGVSQGSQWETTLTDKGSPTLKIPERGRSYSYPISTLPRGTLGTGQVHSAPMLARYPDTALLGHGNYGVRYRLTFPLINHTSQTQPVSVAFETPLKSEEGGKLDFFNPPDKKRVFFRGPLRVRYTDDRGKAQDRYVHIVQHRGETGRPLITLNLRPGEQRSVTIDVVYPPDATPPQVLTIQTGPQPAPKPVPFTPSLLRRPR